MPLTDDERGEARPWDGWLIWPAKLLDLDAKYLTGVNEPMRGTNQ